MAGWQEELAELLGELGVAQEEMKPHLRSTNRTMRNDTRRRPRAVEPPAPDVILGNMNIDAVDNGETATWMTDLRAMRREVDSIVSQVIQLMQRGDLDPSLKEDVMVVLRALRQRAMVTQQAAATDEAYLESATSMLHFCRLVLRLSESALEDM